MPTSSVGATRNRRSTRAGVTLIELVVVITLAALFVSIVDEATTGRIVGAKRTASRMQIDAFKNAIGKYRFDTGGFPSTDQGLDALRIKADRVMNWAGPYLPKDVPLDPWGRAYLYKYPGAHGDEPDIISLGADGREGGAGNDADIVSWKSK